MAFLPYHVRLKGEFGVIGCTMLSNMKAVQKSNGMPAIKLTCLPTKSQPLVDIDLEPQRVLAIPEKKLHRQKKVKLDSLDLGVEVKNDLDY